MNRETSRAVCLTFVLSLAIHVLERLGFPTPNLVQSVVAGVLVIRYFK